MAYGNHTLAIRGCYRHLLKPLAFQFDPERVHDIALRVGSWFSAHKSTISLTQALLSYENPSLETNIAGVHFRNPLGLAAGFDKNGVLAPLIPAVGFGFCELGSVTRDAHLGNVKPRLWRIPEHESLQVHYGLTNRGVDYLLQQTMRYVSTQTFGISIAQVSTRTSTDLDEAIQEYRDVAERVDGHASYVTLNISCPNIVGGTPFTEAGALRELLAALDIKTMKSPLFVKLPPDIEHVKLASLTNVIVDAGVRGILCSNLTQQASVTSPGRGGISGRLLKQQADQQLLQVARLTRGSIALIGVGGISSGRDAYQKIRYGASLVQLVSALIFQGPQVVGEILHDVAELLQRDGYSHIAEAVGADVYTG